MEAHQRRDIIIRSARPREAPALAELCSSAGGIHAGPREHLERDFRHRLRKNPKHFLVAEVVRGKERVIAGMIYSLISHGRPDARTLSRLEAESSLANAHAPKGEGEKHYYITTLAVAPPMQRTLLGHKVAKALIQQQLDLAREMNFTEVWFAAEAERKKYFSKLVDPQEKGTDVWEKYGAPKPVSWFTRSTEKPLRLIGKKH